MIYAPFLAFVAIVLFLASRARELFVLSVRNGRVLVVRGRVPPGFLGDVKGIVATPPVRAATIRAHKDADHARLAISGDIDEGRAQRLRNTFGIRPMAQLRSAPVVNRPTLGQVLGIAWLAWMLDRR
jgi:Protein of unknown function (DUF3634)